MDAEKGLREIKTFADHAHHGKEDNILYPMAMEALPAPELARPADGLCR